jgi:hypothetical protein
MRIALSIRLLGITGCLALTGLGACGGGSNDDAGRGTMTGNSGGGSSDGADGSAGAPASEPPIAHNEMPVVEGFRVKFPDDQTDDHPFAAPEHGVPPAPAAPPGAPPVSE